MTGVVFAMPAMTGITNALPDIPRVYTGICEWLACMVYIAVLYRRASPRRTTIAAMTGLVLLIAVQYFDGMLPIWFWIVGMTLAFGCCMRRFCSAPAPANVKAYISRPAPSCWESWSRRCIGRS